MIPDVSPYDWWTKRSKRLSTKISAVSSVASAAASAPAVFLGIDGGTGDKVWKNK